MDGPKHAACLPAALSAFIWLAAATPAAFAQGHAHEHGVARLEVAVEEGRISVRLESPLQNLVEFERAPRSGAERRQIAAALRQFEAGSDLFRIDPAAGCSLRKIDLQSAALKLGTAPPDPDGHADLDAELVFDCANGNRARYMEVGLFATFPRLQRIEVQAVTGSTQLQATLRRPERRFPLAR
ncbi:MAG: metal transporter substrate-binding protein [Ramlibacter sp.]|nr:metal transporter substrate-binding protein [Ramlibacter sp.]